MPSNRLEISKKLDIRNPAVMLFCLLVVTDVGFILLHFIGSYTQLTSNNSVLLQVERGYSEIFQYVKEAWIFLLLGFLAVRRRSLLLLSWSLLFVYLFLDDSIQIHEKLGMFLSNTLGFSPISNLRARDFGELLVSSVAAVFFLCLISITYRSGDRLSRKASRKLTILLAALAFFGIAVDMFHIAIKSEALESFLAAIEDGGELLVMSTITGFVFSLVEQLQPEVNAVADLRIIPERILSKES